MRCLGVGICRCSKLLWRRFNQQHLTRRSWVRTIAFVFEVQLLSSCYRPARKGGFSTEQHRPDATPPHMHSICVSWASPENGMVAQAMVTGSWCNWVLRLKPNVQRYNVLCGHTLGAAAMPRRWMDVMKRCKSPAE